MASSEPSPEPASLSSVEVVDKYDLWFCVFTADGDQEIEVDCGDEAEAYLYAKLLDGRVEKETHFVGARQVVKE